MVYFGQPASTYFSHHHRGRTQLQRRGRRDGDCHDNTIYFSGCRLLTNEEKRAEPATVHVVIKLATLAGGNFSFYERSTIYIDGQKDEKGVFCRGAGTGPHKAGAP